MSNMARLITAEELERFPEDDSRCELVAGRVVRMTPVGVSHGFIVVRLASLLDSHVRRQGLSVLVVTEVGFKLASNPDTVRAPDVAVMRRHRLPSPLPKGFVNGPPDLVIEVLSPDDRSEEMREKVQQYLARGVTIVVVIDPDRKTVRVWRPSAERVELSGDDALDLDAVVSGFRCPVHELFDQV